jgi:16S rRNA A1518/A1519 N6-dimethyltransferase RsmA/KsgA/DIM1 with predicted DNA glycosylase/AP lyase activity
MDEQQAQKINEAAKEFSDALGNSYQTLTKRTASTQEQVAQLTQAFFEGVMDNLRAQAQGNREMVQELVDQQQQQREATQALAQETSVEDYMRLLDYMCSYYRLLVASRSKRL